MDSRDLDRQLMKFSREALESGPDGLAALPPGVRAVDSWQTVRYGGVLFWIDASCKLHGRSSSPGCDGFCLMGITDGDPVTYAHALDHDAVSPSQTICFDSGRRWRQAAALHPPKSEAAATTMWLLGRRSGRQTLMRGLNRPKRL